MTATIDLAAKHATAYDIAAKHLHTLNAQVAAQALRFKHDMDAATDRMFDEYERECAQDRADGHRPHYCIHGLNLWTDYDPICGPCEDGYTMRTDYGQLNYERAIDKAKGLAADLKALTALCKAAAALHIDGGNQGFDMMRALDTILTRYGIDK